MKSLLSTRLFFTYLLVVVMLVLASYALVFLPNDNQSPTTVFSNHFLRSRKTASELPELASTVTFPVLSAQGALAVDLDSAVVLYEKNADQRLLPASTTKIMTALVAFENYNLEQIVTVGRVNVIGQKMHLVMGEKISVRDLLYGLLVFSANDAAEVLAAQMPGGREAFIEAMNKKAVELHLEHSHFVNPTGLDAIDHYSSARDLVRVAEFAMRNQLFSDIVATKQMTVKSQDGKIVHPLKNINELLGKVDGVVGVKTGWTEGARENLVTLVNRDNKRILIALLGSQDRFGETKELIEWLYTNTHWKSLSFQK